MVWFFFSFKWYDCPTMGKGPFFFFHFLLFGYICAWFFWSMDFSIPLLLWCFSDKVFDTTPFIFDLLVCIFLVGAGRHKNSRSRFSHKQPQFPYCIWGKETKPEPAESHIFPILPSSQCQPAAQPLWQEVSCWRITLGCHYSQSSHCWPWLGKDSCSSVMLLCVSC